MAEPVISWTVWRSLGRPCWRVSVTGCGMLLVFGLVFSLECCLEMDGILGVATYRTITSRPCEVYGLTSCDIGGEACECNHLARLGNSCDNEGCAREKCPAKHCDLLFVLC